MKLITMLIAKPPLHFEDLVPAIPNLCFIIQTTNDDDVHDDDDGGGTVTLSYALWGLSYISNYQFPVLSEIARTGILPRIMQLVMHSSTSIVSPAIEIIASFCSSDDQFTDVCYSLLQNYHRHHHHHHHHHHHYKLK
jgi:importin subunit alpha-1